MTGAILKLWDSSGKEVSVVVPLNIPIGDAAQLLADSLLPTLVGRDNARHVKEVWTSILSGTYDYTINRDFGLNSSSSILDVFDDDDTEMDLKLEEPMSTRREADLIKGVLDTKGGVTAAVGDSTATKKTHAISTSASSTPSCMAPLRVKIGDTEMVRQSNKQVYQCDIEHCGEQFPFKVSLQRHHRIKHNELFCIVCLRAFQHSHICERPHKCSVCGRGFSQKTILEKHMLIHTGEKPHVCETCGKKCRQLSSLQSHQRIHKLRESLPCDECDATFIDEKALKHHKMIHTGEVAHICDVCSQSFSTRSNLKTHLKRFHDTKGISCTVCQKKFAFESELKKHMGKHSETKSHECDLCSVSFFHKQLLVQHKSEVHGEKQHVCEICSSAYSTLWFLTRHMKSHEKEGKIPKTKHNVPY